MRKWLVKALLLGLVAFVGLSASGLFSDRGSTDSADSFVPQEVRRLERFVTIQDDGTATLSPSIGDGASAGLDGREVAALKQGINQYNAAVRSGKIDPDGKQGSTFQPFSSFASTAEAWNSQWVSCKWWGCTFALNHNTTQSLRATISSASLIRLYTQITAACIGFFPAAAWACPILAADIQIAGTVFSWQLGRQDRGGGVYIYATYWKQWPGIVSQ